MQLYTVLQGLEGTAWWRRCISVVQYPMYLSKSANISQAEAVSQAVELEGWTRWKGTETKKHCRSYQQGQGKKYTCGSFSVDLFSSVVKNWPLNTFHTGEPGHECCLFCVWQPVSVTLWVRLACVAAGSMKSRANPFLLLSGGGFFLACKDFGRMFDNSFPTWAFFFFFL